MSKWYILGWPALNPITDISKYHKLGNLNNKNLFSYTSRGWKSKTRVQHGWILVRTPFLLENLFNVVTYPFLPVCQWTEKGLYFSLFRGPPILAALNLKLMMLLHLCYFPKAQSPKTVPVEMRVLTYEVCGGSLVIKSCLIPMTPWTAVHQAPLSMGFPGKDTGLGCHFPLQRIFPTQGSNPRLLHCRWQVLYRLDSIQSIPPLWLMGHYIQSPYLGRLQENL